MYTYKKLSLAVAAMALVGCGPDTEGPKQEVDYSKLEVAPQSSESLVLAEEDALLSHIGNGLRLQAKNGASYRDYFVLDSALGGAPEPAAPSVPTSEANGGGAGFSETNVHVEGVDEADYVKYDGEHWYIATRPEYQELLITQPSPGIKVVSTDPATPNASFVSEYQFSDDWGSVGELYLVSQDESTTHVATLRSQWGDVWPMLPGFPIELAMVDVAFPAVSGGATATSQAGPATNDAAEPAVANALVADIAIWPGPQNSKVRVDLIDVADPGDPQNDWSIELDGSLIESRKVGNTLYLVTRFEPWLKGLNYEYGDLAVRTQNEEALDEISVAEVMPYYRLSGVEAPLSTDCYIQPAKQDYYGLATLIHVTAIDLTGQNPVSSECLNSNVESMSMTPTSLYLTGSYYDDEAGQDKTVVHKFDLSESGPKYAATGSVTGHFGWNSDPAFRMHEYQDQFRVVTSSWTGREGPDHYLTVLTQNGSALEMVSMLPNKDNPEPIGKPGEDVYSVRFEGDRAYIVTFQRTDPLYAIDLTDPANPKVAGELEIPGFATYMHPLGDYLFTLGNEADENGRVTGVKAELISVANDNPEVVTTLSLGGRGTSSPALQDLRAINFLSVGDDSVRIAFPISVYEEYSWAHTGIQLLEVEGLNSSAVMSDAGVMKVESREDSRTYPSYGISRSVLHDDAVFMSFSNDVFAGLWTSPDEVKGPLAEPLFFCTADFRFGLSVEVSLDGELPEGVTACDAQVNAFDGNFSEALQARTSDDPRTCTFVGAGERAGHYVIEASLEGFGGADYKVTVYEDQCHVIPEKVELTLEPFDPIACTAHLAPSIQLELFTPNNDFAECDARVYVVQKGEIYPLELLYRENGSGGATEPTPVTDDGDIALPIAPPPVCVFSGPYELPGEMTLVVEGGNFEPIEQDVFVPSDECHVKTQYFSIFPEPI